MCELRIKPKEIQGPGNNVNDVYVIKDFILFNYESYAFLLVILVEISDYGYILLFYQKMYLYMAIFDHCKNHKLT